MSELLRRVGIEAENSYHAIIKVVRERVREDKTSRKIHEFVKTLPESECRAFLEDALHHFNEAEDACDYGNIMARTLHMYGYEVYDRLKEWRS